MKVLAITQARYGSSRLPGKVLKEINGTSLLEIHLRRILQSKLISKLIVATTNESNADKIVDVSNYLGVSVYKGSLNDVLDRFYSAAITEMPDLIVRITSDCPLVDPVVIDEVIEFAIVNNVDYVANNLNPTYPDGFDVEVFKFKALEQAFKDASLKSDREHVTPYIWRNSTYKGGTLFSSYSFENEKNYSHLRLTVDKVEDFHVIESLVNALGFDKGWMDYVEFLLKHDEIVAMNSQFRRNEGYSKSLLEDNN